MATDLKPFMNSGGTSPNSLNTAEIVTELKAANKNMSALIQVIMGLFVGGQTTTTATAGAQTLPANPAGFLVHTLESGTQVRIPYYNA